MTDPVSASLEAAEHHHGAPSSLLPDDAAARLAALDQAEALAVLQQIEHTPFFQLVRSTTVVFMYSDRDVWAVLGYEGESSDKGGYVDRGFDDLDWLPDPRIEEMSA